MQGRGQSMAKKIRRARLPMVHNDVIPALSGVSGQFCLGKSKLGRLDGAGRPSAAERFGFGNLQRCAGAGLGVPTLHRAHPKTLRPSKNATPFDSGYISSTMQSLPSSLAESKPLWTFHPLPLPPVHAATVSIRQLVLSCLKWSAVIHPSPVPEFLTHPVSFETNSRSLLRISTLASLLLFALERH